MAKFRENRRISYVMKKSCKVSSRLSKKYVLSAILICFGIVHILAKF